MICHACGMDNVAGADRCSHCGMALRKGESGSGGKACYSCGFTNPTGGRFCAHCGVDLKHHRASGGHHRPTLQTQSKQKRRHIPLFRRHPAVIGLVLLGVGLFIAVALQFARDSRTPASRARVIETRSRDPKLEAGVLSIAAKFICSCGSCGAKPLDICACERAIEERQFIRNALQVGRAENEIIAAVNATYGWMKPGSAGKFLTGMPALRGLPVSPTSGGQLTARMPDTSNPSLIDRIATLADREEIFAHFRCPCGQCGMDHLSVCTCQHPRGATEVKAFIDGKISEGKLSLAEVITEVDREYGSRKF